MNAADTTARNDDDTPALGAERVLVVRSVLPGDASSLALTGQETSWTLGRADDCHWPLLHPGVSRRHARIERRGPVYSIRDLGSTNGTYVDGGAVEHASLAVGAVLRLGDWLGVVEEHEGTEQGPYHVRELGPGVWGGALLARTLAPVLRAAHSRIPVLLVGRTGSGKERFAHALHLAGGPERPFQAVNCAALPTSLAEAELFGYRKGAFTGAERSHDGHLLTARRGTLFLDEFADLSLAVQAKLLRALDSGEVFPLGAGRPSAFEGRLVTASQVPLHQLVESGQLREDLAARVSGLVVVLPELSARRGDVPALFHRFLQVHSAGTAPAVSTKVYEQLSLYSWPANVRELEMLARQLLATHGLEPLLRRSHLPSAFRREPSPSSPPREPAAGQPVTLERLTDALRGAQGNVKKAAAAAGISRQRAYRLIQINRLTPVVSAARARPAGGDDGSGE